MRKRKAHWSLAILLAACSVFAPRADAQTVSSVAVSGQLITQGKLNAGGSYTAPSRTTWSTESLLRQLALDEYAAGVWTNLDATGKVPDFPGGSKLVLSSNQFFVAVKSSALLSVSNIISLTFPGTNFVTQTKRGIQTSTQLATFSYDAVPTGGTNQYSISGMAYVQQAGEELLSLLIQEGAGQGINRNGTPIGFSDITITFKPAK